jgi:hypothetical protein
MIPPLVWLGLGTAAIVTAVAVVASNSADEKPVHVVDAIGWVVADPHVLALAAGVSDNVYALASMMQSEAGGHSLLQVATGWAARNEAVARGISVFRLLTRAGHKDKATKRFVPHASDGSYAPGNIGPRYAATRRAPEALALENAAAVLAGTVADPTGGARQFDAPKAQDALLGAIHGYNKSASEVADDRLATNDLVMVPGITSTRFWRPKNA